MVQDARRGNGQYNKECVDEDCSPREPVMISQESVDNLPEDRRREIFLALVEAQDHEMTVSQSREAVAARFGVSEAQVRKIEREGLDNNWPPQ